MSATREGLDFLEELTKYLDWRIKGPASDPEPTDYIPRFRAYLLSREAILDSEVFLSLMANMMEMKKSGGVLHRTPGGG